jgi:sulfur carrier protein
LTLHLSCRIVKSQYAGGAERLRVLKGRPLEPDPGSAGVGKASLSLSKTFLAVSCLTGYGFLFMRSDVNSEYIEKKKRAPRCSPSNKIMKIMLNGEKKEIPENITVHGLLEILDIQHQRVAVELNEAIVKKDTYGSTIIRDGDALEVVSFMGGGLFTVQSFWVRVQNSFKEYIENARRQACNRRY